MSTAWPRQMPGRALFFMQSSGGLTEAHRFQGKDAILSGPAGGIVGMVRTALAAGHRKRHRLRHGRHQHRREPLRRRVRARLRHPGGRRAHARADDEHPHRGCRAAARSSASTARGCAWPGKAGANPGPASYRRGGPLAVTDANVLLGRIQPAHFPQVFGPAPTSRWTARWCSSASPWPRA
jgi:5-oxoprolinase (ATP-hydrolysing)